MGRLLSSSAFWSNFLAAPHQGRGVTGFLPGLLPLWPSVLLFGLLCENDFFPLLRVWPTFFTSSATYILFGGFNFIPTLLYFPPPRSPCPKNVFHCSNIPYCHPPSKRLDESNLPDSFLLISWQFVYPHLLPLFLKPRFPP